MSGRSAPSYAALFETITGQTTVTEPQSTDVSRHVDDEALEQSVAADVDAVVTRRGFEDVIDDPDPY